MTNATYTRALLPPTHAYDALRAQYPDLFLYASEGAHYYTQLGALDQASLDLLSVVAVVLWQILDRFFAASEGLLAVDALIGLAQLRAAWLALHLATIARIAQPTPQPVTLSLSGSGAALLDRTAADLAATLALTGHAWLLRGTQLLLSLSETGG